MRKIVFIIGLLSICIDVLPKSINDKVGESVYKLFSKENANYIIRNIYVFNDTLRIPKNCSIIFRGGALVGPIVFQDTKLKGDVDLKGSSISGSLSIEQFDASWLCYRDGLHDDAKPINEILAICGKVFFPKGRYRLISKLEEPEGLPGKLSTHLAINKNNTHIQGEDGSVFVTYEPLRTLCIYSPPNHIDNSTSNIKIKGMTFEVHNNGETFFEFMHTIRTIGVNGLIIEGCIFDDFWGDAICLSTYDDTPQTGERTRNQNVRILNNEIVGGNHHNNRNGISVVNGKNVTIKNNIIRNTSRNNMPGGIDVEPNNSAYTIDNIMIQRNLLDGIKGSNGAISVCTFKGGAAHRIIIKNNEIRNSSNGLYVYLKTDRTTDNYVIINNIVDSNTNPYRFVGNGISRDWTISGNTFNKPCSQAIPGDIKVENIVVKKNKLAKLLHF